ADVTGLDIRRGEEAVILGHQKGSDGTVGQISIAELAKRADVSHYEIVTRLGQTIPRVYF
ncbi:MAG TPA: alanine racemase C-terminal domain-containing protein, partial [Candidatus Saccharimonadales bacterium]|nr:alanine racemase C-terminal domain-containing protein [Candidatus Saccharimonadales bacterium]